MAIAAGQAIVPLAGLPAARSAVDGWFLAEVTTERVIPSSWQLEQGGEGD